MNILVAVFDNNDDDDGSGGIFVYFKVAYYSFNGV